LAAKRRRPRLRGRRNGLTRKAGAGADAGDGDGVADAANGVPTNRRVRATHRTIPRSSPNRLSIALSRRKAKNLTASANAAVAVVAAVARRS
jgi:hypothetical protein